jgi:hypothetical protein
LTTTRRSPASAAAWASTEGTGVGSPHVPGAGGSSGGLAGLARSTRRAISVRVVVNRVRRNTTLARHVSAEIDRLDRRA